MSSNEGLPGRPASELTLRVISALIMIGIALAATWAGGMYFVILCAVAGFLVLLEFFDIVGRVRDWARWAAFGAYGATLLALLANGMSIAVAVGLAFILALLMAEFVVRRSCWGAGGLLYAQLPFFALVQLRGDGQDSLVAILIVFACVWGADTAAYFVGRGLGGPKLAPIISPKKTWSGLIGGLAGGVAASICVAYIFATGAGLAGVAIAIALGTSASIGDLWESWIKRKFGRKDSGNLIPGHGGILDRIDGLIFAAVLAWLIGWYAGGDAVEPGESGAAFSEAFLLP